MKKAFKSPEGIKVGDEVFVLHPEGGVGRAVVKELTWYTSSTDVIFGYAVVEIKKPFQHKQVKLNYHNYPRSFMTKNKENLKEHLQMIKDNNGEFEDECEILQPFKELFSIALHPDDLNRSFINDTPTDQKKVAFDQLTVASDEKDKVSVSFRTFERSGVHHHEWKVPMNELVNTFFSTKEDALSFITNKLINDLDEL